MSDSHFGKDKEKRKPKAQNLITFRMDQLTRSLPSSDLADIEGFIASELRRLRPKGGAERDMKSKDYFMIYKHAFDQLIEHKATVSKDILTAVKGEYEESITALETGHSQAVYLQGMLESMMVEKSTLRHYINRGDELEEKLEKLQAHNNKLRKEIVSSSEGRAQRVTSVESKSLEMAVKDTRMLIPGLSLEDLTDLNTLSTTLSNVKAQVQQLNKATDTNFVEKKKKGVLYKQLLDKESTKSDLVARNEKLKVRYETLKVAVEVSSVRGTGERGKVPQEKPSAGPYDNSFLQVVQKISKIQRC